MKSFLDKVQLLLAKRSKSELNAFIMRVAETIQEEKRSEFIGLLDNKRIIISSAGRDILDVDGILARIRQFSEEIEEYEIEAYYEDNWDDEGYNIETDDGFCDDLSKCYYDAVKLLNHGFYYEAADAFQMISNSIEAFDEYNESNDCGAIYVHTFVDEKWLDFDLTMVSTLGVYSTLLTEKLNEDQVFNEMFLELAGSRGKLTFGDYIYAGSVPVPK